MKNRIIALAVALMAGASMMLAGTQISLSKLPKVSQTFISKYFAGDKVKKVESDQGRHGVEYEVDMTSGAEIEFRADGNWKSVKAAKGKTVPSAIVPAAISRYVQTNHKGQTIREISFKRGVYEVELSNGKELHLDKDGKAATQTRPPRDRHKK